MPSSLEAETAQTIDVDKINEVGSLPMLSGPKLTDDQQWLLKSGMLVLLGADAAPNCDAIKDMIDCALQSGRRWGAGGLSRALP